MRYNFKLGAVNSNKIKYVISASLFLQIKPLSAITTSYCELHVYYLANKTNKLCLSAIFSHCK